MNSQPQISPRFFFGCSSRFGKFPESGKVALEDILLMNHVRVANVHKENGTVEFETQILSNRFDFKDTAWRNGDTNARTTRGFAFDGAGKMALIDEFDLSAGRHLRVLVHEPQFPKPAEKFQ